MTLILSGFREWQFFPKSRYDLQCFMPVAEIEDVAFFRTLVGTSGLSIGHQIGNAWKLLDKGGIIAGCNHAFVVEIDNVVAHHLPGADLSQW